MTTTQKSRSTQKSTPAPAKSAAAKSTPAPAKRTAPKPEAKEEAKAPKAPALPTYRDVEDFTSALKAAKSAAKGNADLTAPLQLITHLAWKTPGGSVGWAKNTTQAVMDYANDSAIPEGTPIPDAMSAALSAAEKAATEKPQKDALAVLARLIKAHAA